MIVSKEEKENVSDYLGAPSVAPKRLTISSYVQVMIMLHHHQQQHLQQQSGNNTLMVHPAETANISSQDAAIIGICNVIYAYIGIYIYQYSASD